MKRPSQGEALVLDAFRPTIATEADKNKPEVCIDAFIDKARVGEVVLKQVGKVFSAPSGRDFEWPAASLKALLFQLVAVVPATVFSVDLGVLSRRQGSPNHTVQFQRAL